MEEIEVGSYVRTKEGEIHKIIEIVEDTNDWNYYKYENCMGDFEICIKKHSKNIIVLIEAGDYVNGYLVIAKSDDGYIEIAIGDDTEQGELLEISDIKTILTKEQYESNCYRLEE